MSVNLRKRRRNRAAKALIKSSVSELNRALSGKDIDRSRESLRKAIRTLDKAAAKGIIHPNTSSRKKSSLTRKLNRLASQLAKPQDTGIPPG